MKKIATMMMAALLFAGMVACEKKGGDAGNGGDSTATAAGAAASGATNAVNAPVADPNAPAETPSNLPLTTASFSEESHNFGMIKEGAVVEHTFKFKNTGTQPLHIESVKPSCGCTTPDWTKEDVPPGGEGFIKVSFNSEGKSGVQKKSVTVTANTDPRTKILNFSGEVTPK